MKSILTTLVAVAATFVVAGCGGGSSDTAGQATAAPRAGSTTLAASGDKATAANDLHQPLDCDASPTQAQALNFPVPEAKKRYRVTFMEVSLAAYYYVGMDYAAKQAAKEAGVELTTVSGKGYTSPDQQLSQAEAAIQRGTDAIVLAPSDVKGSVPVVELAKSHDIPVVNISSEVASPDVWSVQQDDYTFGRDLAKQLAKVVGPNGGPGIYVAGPQTATFAIKREAGFTDELKQNHPGITVAAATHTLVDPGAGLKAFQDAATAHPDYKWIAGNGYILAPPDGLPESAKGKPYVTMQYEPDSIKALENGSLTSVFGIEPIPMGRIGVARAVEILNGGSPPRMTCVSAPLFTKADIGTKLADQELIPAGYKP